jgi:ATP-dependent DNA helicase RecG
MNPESLLQLIREGETMDIEFKGEEKSPLSDNDLVEAVVCLCNRPGSEPGYLLIGVEDDGRITGARPRQDTLTHPGMVSALISGRTRPAQSCLAEIVEVSGKPVLVIQVMPSRTPVGTGSGKHVRRAMGSRGQPECLPYHFHEMQSSLADRQFQDYTAVKVAGATWDHLDPLEFERFRRCVRESRGRGDAALLELHDLELAKALGAVEANGSVSGVRVLGLLLFGREAALRDFLPGHEVAFQELAGTTVQANEFERWPLLRSMEFLMDRLQARNREQEVNLGMLRISVPDYPERALREAVANALVHRDYTRMGAVHVQLHEDRLEVSNPGGFPEGVTLANLLVTPPRARNLLLADAFKRAGLVERTARGIDTIFEEQLRNGRPAPIYDRSSSVNVVVVLPGGAANLDFIRCITEESQQGVNLRLDDLLVLNNLWHERRCSSAEAAVLIQKSDAEARNVLLGLVERGMVEARGDGKGRSYHLSAAIYRRLGDKSAYIHQRGFEPIQQEQMVLQYLATHRKIARREIADLCKISPGQARTVISRLLKAGKLVKVGEKRGAFYELKR